MRGFLMLVPLLVTLAACGRQRAGESTAWAPEDAWRLEVTWTVGGAEAEGDAAFGDLTGLAVDARGQAWVVDRQAQHLVVVRDDGSVARTVGRKGGGPGEFEGIYGVTVTRDGHIWVPDTRNLRYTVFTLDGTFVTSYRRPANCYGYAWPGGATDDGSIRDVICAEADGERFHQLVRFDTLAQAYVDSLRIPQAAAEPGPPLYDFRDDRGRGGIAGVPFTASQAWTLNADGTVWVGWGGTYAITRQTLAGDTLVVVRHDGVRAPVSSEERERAIAGIERFAQGRPFDESRIPAVHPYFARLLEDDRGHLWVQRQVEGGWAFDVFAPDGTFLGEVPVPAGIGITPYLPAVIRGAEMWAVTRDEFDAAVVTRIRIVGRE